jgi:hypothetical protein
MTSWNWASWYWAAWILLGFAPLEFWALGTGKPQYTLSDQIWHLEGTGATFGRYVVAALCLWLFLHMVFHAFR